MIKFKEQISQLITDDADFAFAMSKYIKLSCEMSSIRELATYNRSLIMLLTEKDTEKRELHNRILERLGCKYSDNRQQCPEKNCKDRCLQYFLAMYIEDIYTKMYEHRRMP